jgi:hypothetical protein
MQVRDGTVAHVLDEADVLPDVLVVAARTVEKDLEGSSRRDGCLRRGASGRQAQESEHREG